MALIANRSLVLTTKEAKEGLAFLVGQKLGVALGEGAKMKNRRLKMVRRSASYQNGINGKLHYIELMLDQTKLREIYDLYFLLKIIR